MKYVVYVGVALSRPPKVDDYVRVVVDAASPTEASLIAAQMASTVPGVAMPVSTEIE